MTRTLTLAAALAAMITLPAAAQAVKSPPAATAMAPAENAIGLSLTTEQADAWIGKPVYSRDGSKMGEVAAFQRSADNKVTGMHADIGSFQGFGEHRVKLVPAQFKMESDRVVLGLTAAQAKELPNIYNKS